MATLSSDSDPDAKPFTQNANVVFIDTNLDTHLAVFVSNQDTVSDLKKRVLSEHLLCFPKLGQIQINSIKVKRKGYFYHLSDSMVVRSAFHGFNKSWFLSVDASALGYCGKNGQLCSSGSPNKVACLENANNALIGPVDIAMNDEKEEIAFDNPCVSEHTGKEAITNSGTSAKSSGNNDNEIPLLVAIPETQEHCHVNLELPTSQIECKVDGPSKGMKDDCKEQEKNLMSVASTKKKRKRKEKNEDMVRDDTPKENIASVYNPLSFASKKVCSFNTSQVPELENKQDGLENKQDEGEHVTNLEMVVKSSINDDPGIPLPGSVHETQDHCNIIPELPSSHIEGEVDGFIKGIKDHGIVPEERTSKSVQSPKKKRKSKRNKEETVQDDTSKENDASVFGPANDTVKQNTVILANPSENADDRVILESEVLKEHQHTECNDSKTKNDIDTESMKEASDPEHSATKKHKKKKRSLTHDSKETLKVETASLKDDAQKSDKAHKDGKESKDLFEFDNEKLRGDVEYKHNKVAEVVSDAKPHARKKQKGREKGGDKSLLKETLSMNHDFNVDNASHRILEEQQKIKNSCADQSGQHFDDTDSVRTSEEGRRKKRKKNPLNSTQTPIVTSSRKDNEANPSSIQDVQEETSEDGLFSKDISMCKATLENMEIATDACKEGIPSTDMKHTGNDKNLYDTDIKAHPSDVNEPKALTEDNENIVLDHRLENEAGQTKGDEEGREVSAPNDPKLVLLEDAIPPNQDNTHANLRESNVSSEVVNVSEMTESVKSEKKRRGKKKAKGSGGVAALREDMGLVDASESETDIVKFRKPSNYDPMSESRADKLEATKGHTHAESFSSSQLLSSKKEHDGLRTHPDKKAPNLQKRGHDAKLSSRSNSPMSSIRENRNPEVDAVGKSKDLEEPRQRLPVSNSKPEVSKKMAQNKEGIASSNNIGKVASNTRQKKSLLAGAIFKDDSSSNSEDEVDNTDASSTKTPSDDSLLSEFSDVDSIAGPVSQQNGSHGDERLENGGRSALKASLSNTKGMPIDRVLRSSSRYKKAKITASQTDSQLEFVPDSLADL